MKIDIHWGTFLAKQNIDDWQNKAYGNKEESNPHLDLRKNVAWRENINYFVYIEDKSLEDYPSKAVE